MRRLVTVLAAVTLAFLTAPVLSALQFEQASTFAYSNAAAVTTVLDEAVWRIRNQACTFEGPMAIDPECGEVVTADYTDDLQSMHWFLSGGCQEEVKGYHSAIPEQGSSISAESTAWCP